MPRGRRAKLSDEFTAETALKYHVDAFQLRKGGKGFGITKVHHIQFGWMPIDRYYGLQKLHDLEPVLLKLIEGGYRLKQAIYGFEIEILGTDIPGIPVGASLMGIILGKIALSIKDQRNDQALLWSLALALPFGEIAAIWRLTQEAFGLAGEPWWGFGAFQIPPLPEHGVPGEPGMPGEDL